MDKAFLPQWTSLNRFPYQYNGAEYSLPCHQADFVGRSNEIVSETSLNIEADVMIIIVFVEHLGCARHYAKHHFIITAQKEAKKSLPSLSMGR